MLREATKHLSHVSVESFGGLLVDYARERGAGLILRGIRAVSDYEYEFADGVDESQALARIWKRCLCCRPRPTAISAHGW